MEGPVFCVLGDNLLSTPLVIKVRAGASTVICA